MSVDYFSLGQRIQTRRKAIHKTQEDMAEYISVTVGYISQIERGITKVNLETLSNISEFLDCDITEFLGGTTRNSQGYLVDDLQMHFDKLTATNKRMLLDICHVLLKNQADS